jgi:hypothetical protein
LDLLDNEFSLVRRTLSKLAAIRTALGMKGGEASFFVGIPPILQSAGGQRIDVGRGRLLDGLSQRDLLVQSVLNLGD